MKSPNRKNSEICVKSSLDIHKFTINIVVSKTIVDVPYANTYKTIRASVSTWSFLTYTMRRVIYILMNFATNINLVIILPLHTFKLE